MQKATYAGELMIDYETEFTVRIGRGIVRWECDFNYYKAPQCEGGIRL